MIDVFTRSIASGIPYDIVQRFRRGESLNQVQRTAARRRQANNGSTMSVKTKIRCVTMRSLNAPFSIGHDLGETSLDRFQARKFST
jgi:hypothetical protein